MDINRIIYCYLLITIVSFTSVGFAQSKSDTIKIDSRWSTLNNILLSEDGSWSLMTINSKEVEFLLINTHTRKQHRLKNISRFYMLKNNIFLYQDLTNKSIRLFNLENDEVEEIKDAILLDFIKEENIIIYKSEFGNQNFIVKYENDSLSYLCETIDLHFKNYSISPDKKCILYQSALNDGLFKISLHNNMHTFIDSPAFHIDKYFWRHDSKFVSFYLQDITQSREIHILEIEKNVLKDVKLPKESFEFSNINDVSYFDGRIIVEYQLKQTKGDVLQPDIWSTNNQNLREKLNVSSAFFYYPRFIAFDLNTLGKTSINLERNTRLLNIGSYNNLISYNSTENYDYSHFKRPTNFYLLDNINFDSELIVEQLLNYNSNFSYSPNGEYIAYRNYKNWLFYNLKTKQVIDSNYCKTNFDNVIWSSTSTSVYGFDNNSLIKLNLSTLKLDSILIDKGANLQFTFYNTVPIEGLNTSHTVRALKFDIEGKVLFSTKNLNNNLSSLYLLENGILKTILKDNPNSINNLLFDRDFKVVTYSEENFNMPVEIRVWRDGQTKVLKENETPKELYRWRKQEVIEYIVDGKSMKGVLYYPKNFRTGEKYPMITSIYQIQYKYANFFEASELAIDGFSTNVYTENDYFVFYPDIIYNSSGPALSALQCVEAAIKTILIKEKGIDVARLGLTGRSHGGYETNYIVTQTNMFKAAVSGVGNSDLIRAYYSYNLNFGVPNYFKMENGQFEMPTDFAGNQQLYLNNSPILYAHQIKTPLLTWTGNKDENVHWGQTKELFVALLRYRIPHVALFYPNETHSILNSSLRKDLNNRVLQWFNFYLKGHKDIKWIEKATEFY